MLLLAGAASLVAIFLGELRKVGLTKPHPFCSSASYQSQSVKSVSKVFVRRSAVPLKRMGNDPH